MNNTCPKCGAVYGISEQHIGRGFVCKTCGSNLIVEASGLQISGPPPASSYSDRPPRDYADDDRFPSGSSTFVDYLVFRKMVVPIIIQIVFWCGVALTIIASFVLMVVGASQPGGGPAIFIGLISLPLGPVLCRIYCEMLIVMFRINDTLTDIKNDCSEDRADQRSEVRGQRSEVGGRKSEVRGRKSEGMRNHFSMPFAHDGCYGCFFRAVNV